MSTYRERVRMKLFVASVPMLPRIMERYEIDMKV
jgi:hypothetical protein